MVDDTDARGELGLLAASPEEVMAASVAEVLMDREEAQERVRRIRSNLGSIRADIRELRDREGWRALNYTSWAHCVASEFTESYEHVRRQIAAADVEKNIAPIGVSGSIPESHLRPLTPLPRDEQREVWAEVQEKPGPVTARKVEAIIERRKAELVQKPGVMDVRRELVMVNAQRTAPLSTFNRTNDKVSWAWWTWNPVTGCLHDCPYCYARDLAERFYPQKFVPTFHADRLSAPRNTKLPSSEEPESRRVFACSMADLFGKWVPQEWIDAVFQETRSNPQWKFLFLTKFPQRLAELEWPDNAWVGTTVDRQYRVDIAEKAFRGVKAGIKWLSCEPMLEPLKFSSLEMFDWVVIGGASRSSRTPEFWPPFDWQIDLYAQARAAGCKVWFKENAISQINLPQEEP